MKNILMTCPWDVPVGGVSDVIRNLIISLKNQGAKTYLLYPAQCRTLKMTKKSNSWGEESYYFHLRTISGKKNILLSILAFLLYFPFALTKLASFIKRNHINIIHCHYLTEYFIYFALLAKVMNVKLVLSVHGTDIKSYSLNNIFTKSISKIIVYCADKIVACSNSLAKDTKIIFPFAGNKIIFIHNGISLSEFSTAHNQCGINTPFLLTIAHQVRHKGIDALLKAFEIVQRQFRNHQLVIIGDGPLLNNHRELALSLGINDKVIFLGQKSRDEVRSFIADCSLFIHPARAEAFGIVLLEASYYKKGIIATNVGGIPEVLTDNVNAFLVETDNYIEMANKIIMLLKSPFLLKEFGENAHRSLIENFLWENKVKDYLLIFSD